LVASSLAAFDGERLAKLTGVSFGPLSRIP
jgi:hypothetical protein